MAEIADCLLFPIELAPLLPELAMFSSVNLPQPKAGNKLQAIFENLLSLFQIIAYLVDWLSQALRSMCISIFGGT